LSSPACCAAAFSYQDVLALADDRQNGPDDRAARIARAKLAQDGAAGIVAAPSGKGYKQGSRVLAELIGAPIGGAVLGWGIESLFGTSPWGLLILLTLSVVVAFRNILRISRERPE
jgi:ATP synthase protein I